MLLFRSIVVGLLGACCLLLAVRPRCEIAVRSLPRSRPTVRPGRPAPDDHRCRAAGRAEASSPKLVRLAPGEHVIAIDDARVAGDSRRARCSQVDQRPEHYVDLTVAGPLGERRVLVLLH